MRRERGGAELESREGCSESALSLSVRIDLEQIGFPRKVVGNCKNHFSWRGGAVDGLFEKERKMC